MINKNILKLNEDALVDKDHFLGALTPDVQPGGAVVVGLGWVTDHICKTREIE